MPERIQRRRVKGWTAPENTVYVGRGSKYGNPFKVGGVCGDGKGGFMEIRPEVAVGLFKQKYEGHFNRINLRAELGGKNLMCWCKVGQPCHADLLLEWVANA